MAKSDIFIGFETRPENLEGFLVGQGYELETNVSDEMVKAYKHSEKGFPELDYHAHFIQDDDEFPDWRNRGYNLASLLAISFPCDDKGATDEALRLSRDVTRKFNGILYDENLDDFFRGNEL